MKFILIGFKNSGKTQFGSYLASRLDIPFMDVDQLIEDSYYQQTKDKRTFFSIYQKYGDSYFRKIEKEVIKNVSSSGEAVLSTGGGSLLDSENIASLKKLGSFIYLRVAKETLLDRLKQSRLPNFIDQKDFTGSFERAFEKREQVYKKTADITLDIDDLNRQQIFEAFEQAFIREAIVG